MDDFTVAERAVIAGARRRRFRSMTDIEKLLVHKYWRQAKQRSRDGKPGGDRRMNPEFREWLKRKGYRQAYSNRRYYQWIRERGKA